MSRLMRDGTAEFVSRDQILRRERGQGNVVSATLHGSALPSLYVMTIQTYIH